ncbi:MAG TPA: hypothetical protein VGL19_08640 [Polyangiaceae bacterium]
MRLAPLTLGVLGLASAVACSRKAPSLEPISSASTSASVRTAESTTAPAASVAHVTPAKGACRALVVNGKATVNATPITTGMLLDGEHWLELEAGASVALRHSITSREFKLLGPSKVLPCRGGAEQILLARGQLVTSANLGVRPGAEVLIATPLGTVRYGDAALDVEVNAKRLNLRVKQGQAWLEPEKAGKPSFKNPVSTGAEAYLAAPASSAPKALEACENDAQRAHDSALRVVSAGPAGSARSLGDRTAENMRARASARRSCAVAAATLGTLDDPADRLRLSAAVAHADELWQSVPPAAPAPATEQKN